MELINYKSSVFCSISREGATAWRGLLSADQFVQRNLYLHSLPFGKKNIQTLALRKKKTIVASLDLIRVPFLKSSGAVVDGFHIASVIVPEKFRGQGFASELLEGVLKDEPYILYSDIGPPFYERLGFRAFPASSVLLKVLEGASGAEKVSGGEFISAVQDYRKKSLPPGCVTRWPIEDWWEWRLARNEIVAKLTGKSKPSHSYWEFPCGHFCSTGDEVLTKVLNVMWLAPGCDVCLESVRRLGSELGAEEIRYWLGRNSSIGGKMEYPMIRFPGEEPGYFDNQLGEWW